MRRPGAVAVPVDPVLRHQVTPVHHLPAEQRTVGEVVIRTHRGLEIERVKTDEVVAVEVSVPVEWKIIEAESVAGGIALESRGYDLVVLGAAREPYLQQVMFGEIPEKVARYSPASVLVVKRYEGHVRSWLKRTLG